MSHKFLIILFILSVVSFKKVFSQDQVLIYGIVKSETKKPIVGAKITPKHQYQRSFTDDNGWFKMFITGVDTIKITYVGFKPVTKIIDEKLDSVLRITMEPLIELKKVRNNPGKVITKHKVL